MAQIPGSVPLTGKVAPTDTTDTFATHVDIYGEGGYMTVADQTEREAITTERRKQGMAVFQNDTNEMYILQDGVTNADWVLFSGGGGSQDLQSVLENGSQFTLPFPYTGGLLDINYSGATGDPFDPTVNSSGIRIKQDIPPGGAGESIYIAASGSADLGWVSLHAQGVSSFPTVDYSRINILQGGISIDTNNTDFADTEIGDSLSVVGIATGAGGGNTNYTIGTQPGVQQAKLSISDADVQILHTTGIDVTLSGPGGGIPTNKFLNVLNIMVFTKTQFTNSVNLNFYLDGCSAGGGQLNKIYAADLITGQQPNTGIYAGRSNNSESFGLNCSSLTARLSGASGAVVAGSGGIDVYVTYQFIEK